MEEWHIIHCNTVKNFDKDKWMEVSEENSIERIVSTHLAPWLRMLIGMQNATSEHQSYKRTLMMKR